MPRELIFHIINLLVSLISAVVVLMIIFRTRKGLDRAFKMFFLTTVTLVIATAMQINEYFFIIPAGFEEVIFITSRMLATFFFLFGCLIFLRIVSERQK